MNDSRSKSATSEVVAVVSAAASHAQEKCRAHHTGPWMIEPDWFAKTVDMINKGQLQPKGDTVDPDDDDEDDAALGPYQTVNGIAVIPLAGALMKARSKYGGTSTIDARNAVRTAANDSNVSAILLHIDSPGGTSAGTDALAQDVAAANDKKPVYAHIEDMGASAAYWIASQAQRVTASRGSLVGSLGTRMAVVDSSAAAAQEGLKVLSFATGEFKAAGLDGTTITDRQAAYFQQIVDDSNAHFKNAVASGRSMTQYQVNNLFDGRVHDAATAKTLGLIDDVSTLDAVVMAILQETSTMNGEAFKSYAAEHPEAVASYIEQGRKVGLTDGTAVERTRSKAIADACDGNYKLAVDAIVGNHDAESVRLATVATADIQARATADAKASADALAAKDAEIAKLKEQAAFVNGSQPAVASRGDARPADTAARKAPTDKASAEALAKADWESNRENCTESYMDLATYTATLKREFGIK